MSKTRASAVQAKSSAVYAPATEDRGRQNFTVRLLDALKPKAKRYNVVDSDTRGLGICVFPSGAKTFYHVRKVQGWPQRCTLGTYPEYSLDDARGKASELNGKLARWRSDGYEGQNPTKKSKKVPTLGEVLEHYVENHLKVNAKTPEHAVWYANWQFDSYLTAWRNRPLTTIGREHVRERHAEIARNHGDVTANRTITFLRTLINHAIHPDVALWDGTNVAKDPKKFLAAETGRDRTLQRSEAPSFFGELKKEPNADLRDAVLLALFTGQRRGSILAMRWPDLDLRRGLWTVTTAKGKKGKAPHIVPLIDEAIALLKRRPRVDDSEWVFTGRKGRLTTLKAPWQEFIKRTGITNLTFHDLRRSLATAEGDTGASTEVIQKTLGHTENSAATKIYDRSDRRDEVRQAMKKASRTMLRAGKIPKRELLAVNPTKDSRP